MEIVAHSPGESAVRTTLLGRLPSELRVELTRFLYDTDIYLYLPSEGSRIFDHFLYLSSAAGTFCLRAHSGFYRMRSEDTYPWIMGSDFIWRRGGTSLRVEDSFRVEVSTPPTLQVLAYLDGAFSYEYDSDNAVSMTEFLYESMQKKWTRAACEEFLESLTLGYREYASSGGYLVYPRPTPEIFPDFDLDALNDYKMFGAHLSGGDLINPLTASVWLERALNPPPAEWIEQEILPGLCLREEI